jgi:hypothetical protein
VTGRHLVWPCRCSRHGAWRGPYEEGTLFFYIDEYIKDAPKDLLTALSAPATGWARA